MASDELRIWEGGLAGACGRSSEFLWRQVATELTESGSGQDHSDDVQDAVLSLLSAFGCNPEPERLLRVRWIALRRRQVDRNRRAKRMPALREDLDLLPDPVTIPEGEPEGARWRREASFTNLLGVRGEQLLGLLSEGRRATSVLACCLGADRKSVRRWRLALVRCLQSYQRGLAENLAPDSPPSND